MKILFKCKCGEYNYTWQDWISHYKYGLKGKLRAVKLFLLTSIEIRK